MPTVAPRMVLWAASAALLLVPSCIGREAGSRLTSLNQDDQFVEQSPTLAPETSFPNIVDATAPTGAATVNLSTATRHQVLEGFGAAAAWYEERIVGQTPKGLYEFLFPELGLDIIRFRNRHNRSDFQDEHPEWDAEIFRRGSEALGHPLKVMLASWSPPAALKASGAEKCKGNDSCTLAKENGQFVYDKFADYWLESLKHYEKLGIAPEYVSIQNEPDFIPPDWEGCKFTPTETAQFPGYARALAAVHAKLKSAALHTKLIGPEVLGIHYNRVQEYLGPMNLDLVHGVAHHIYESGPDKIWDWRDPGPDSFLDEMRGVADLVHQKKPLFQTEFGTDEDRGIDGGFETAWLMHHSLVEEGVASFIYWELIWDGNKGLVGMHGKSPQPRDHYYAMRHYARFTDPGYVRVQTDSDSATVLASSYLSPDAGHLAVVLLNTGKNTMRVTVHPGDFVPGKLVGFRTTFRPGHSKRWEPISVAPGSLNVEMPARSVVTLAMDR